MTTDEIKLLYEYNTWADGRILETTARVSQEQYVAATNTGISHRSLRATLIHILDGLWQWRITCQGYYAIPLTEEEYRATELTEAQFPTLHDLVNRWLIEQREMRIYLRTLDDEKLNGVLRYFTEAGEIRERILWHCLVHVVNHSTQHRSEAAALLTSYRHSPGDLDFTLFLNENSRLME